MQFDPNKAIPTPKAGYYKFVITTVEFKIQGSVFTEAVDKNGNAYFKPTLAVFVPGKDGVTWSSRPFISASPRMMFKLKHLCEIAGVDFASGDIDPQDFIGVEGWAKFSVDMSGYNDYEVDDFLPERKIAELESANKVEFQLALKAYREEQAVVATNTPDDDSDSIPF